MLKTIVRTAAESRFARGRSPAAIVVKNLADAAMKSFELMTKLMGPVLIVLAIILISTVVFTWFDSIMPALGFDAFGFGWTLLTTFGIWILVNVVLNYGASILTSPGFVPRNTGNGTARNTGFRQTAGVAIDLEAGSGDAASPASLTGGSASAGGVGLATVAPVAPTATAEGGEEVRLVIQPAGASAPADLSAASTSSGVALAHTAAGGRRRAAGAPAPSSTEESHQHEDDEGSQQDEPDDEEENAVDEAAAERAYLEEMVRGDPNRIGHCRKCDGPKPPRTHHCHVCGKCVLKMDHHCPWLGNCVGFHNYAYFFKMLFYFWTGCVYVVCVSLLPFMETLTPRPFRPNGTGTGTHRPPVDASMSTTASLGDEATGTGTGSSVDPILAAANAAGFGSETRVTLVFIICLSVGFAVALLFSWHVYLLLTNQTSIEYLTNTSLRFKLRHRGMVYKNPFDLGWGRNWVSVFGTGPWYHFFLPVLYKGLGDGMRYETNR